METVTYTKIDVIIPCYNSEATIWQCLSSIYDQDLSESSLNVIVVDNGSTDKTVEIASTFPCNILLRPGINVGAVRNRGVDVATGELLAFTDSDCVVPQNWLSEAAKYFEDESVGAVGGGCLAPDDACWIEKAWVSNQQEPVKYSMCLPASNMVVRRDLFALIGGFNESIIAGEDDELSTRIREKKLKLISVKSCFIIHLGYPKTARDIVRRQVWHAKNSIEIRDGILDKMFIATNVFLLSISISILSILFPWQYIFIFVVSSLVMFGVVVSTAAIKVYRSYAENPSFLCKLVKFLQLIYIYFFFFIGRSVGLLFNYKNRFFYWFVGK